MTLNTNNRDANGYVVDANSDRVLFYVTSPSTVTYYGIKVDEDNKPFQEVTTQATGDSLVEVNAGEDGYAYTQYLPELVKLNNGSADYVMEIQGDVIVAVVEIEVD